MTEIGTSLSSLGKDYGQRLSEALALADWEAIDAFGEALLDCWKNKKQVFICGNGGSAGNAVHLANDYIYGIAKQFGAGLNIHALTANTSVITCLGNDIGYEHIFSHPLMVQANEGDVLIVLSGSGNSPNIIQALEKSKEIGMTSFAILGFSGGKAKELADVPIHFPVEDMQISEDLQVIVGHMSMQWLYNMRENVLS